MIPTFARVVICAIPVDAIGIPELHHRILHACTNNEHINVLHVNAHAINIATTDTAFRKVLQKGDVVFADGEGIRIAALLHGTRIPERITYADWLWNFAPFLAQNNLSIFLLGGVPGRAEAAAAALRHANPSLKIAGTHHGYFDKGANSLESKTVISCINSTSAQVLLVCFGMPIQEKWLETHRHLICSNVALTGGAALDYISGAVRRPPKLVRSLRSEWVGRLLIEPTRLWRRYIIGNPVFLWRILKSAISSRFREAESRP